MEWENPDLNLTWHEICTQYGFQVYSRIRGKGLYLEMGLHTGLITSYGKTCIDKSSR